MTESSGKPPNLRKDDAIHAEHVQVRAIAQQLLDTEDPNVLLPLLREHRGMLCHHFAAEEATDGLYDSILETAPEKQRQVQHLRHQHHSLLERIDGLCHVAEGGETVTYEEIRSQIRALARELREHESEEGDLLLEVMNTDLGTGD